MHSRRMDLGALGTWRDMNQDWISSERSERSKIGGRCSIVSAISDAAVHMEAAHWSFSLSEEDASSRSCATAVYRGLW